MEKIHSDLAILLEIIIIILYITKVQFSFPQEDQYQYWKTLQDIHIMLFVGFGFLMVFLKRYAFSSVSYTYLVGTIAIQVGVLYLGLWDYIFCDKQKDECHSKIKLDLTMLIRGDVAGVTVLITVGAVLGKYTPFQLMVMVLMELFFYALNERLVYKVLGAADLGASISVHLFGALFGVILSMYSCNKKASTSKHFHESYNNDLTAMIGTLFLFVYWPSFNGGLSHKSNFHRVVLNTALSLTSSVCTTCVFSPRINNGKLKMEHILNATLAGGVMIGTACDMINNPGVSLAIGFFAGLISTVGFQKLSVIIGTVYHDTCGVTYLHLIPGLIGALIGVVCAAVSEQSDFEDDITTIFIKRGAPDNRDAKTQAQYQLYAILVTIVISGISARFSAIILKLEFFHYEILVDRMFYDDIAWDTGDEQAVLQPSQNSPIKQDNAEKQNEQTIELKQLNDQLRKENDILKKRNSKMNPELNIQQMY